MKKVPNSCISLVHELLNDNEILHFVHHVTDNSIVVYVSKEYHPFPAARILSTIPILKTVKCGIDEDNDCWVELYF